MQFSTRHRDKSPTEPSDDPDVGTWSSSSSRWLPARCMFPPCAVPAPVPGLCQSSLNMTRHTTYHNAQARTCVSHRVMSCMAFFFLILNSLFFLSCCIDCIMGLCYPGEINPCITFVLWKKSKYLIPTVKATAIISCFWFFILTSWIPSEASHSMGPNWEKQSTLLIFKYCL